MSKELRMPRALPFSLLLPLLLTLPSWALTQQIRIVHWNDFHAHNVPEWTHIDGGDSLRVGGAATLTGFIEHYRNGAIPCLALHAGDDFQGSPICSMTNGMSQIELLNLIHPDAYELGNHEFDYGLDAALADFHSATFPVLLGNVVRADTGQLLFPADTVLTCGHVRVGVIGVLIETLHQETTKHATENLETIPVADAVRSSLDRLEPITDIQIVLSHEGVHEDSLLALAIGDRIELIAGGHSHTLLKEPLWVNGVPILQAGSFGRWLGVVDLIVDTDADKVTKLEARVEPVQAGIYPPDQAVAAAVEKQEAELSGKLDEVVATLRRDWVCHDLHESNVGQWVADAIRKSSGTDIAFVNTGGLRSDITAGPLTVREIMQVCPFGNELVEFSLSGKQIEEYLCYEAEMTSRFLIPGGLKYTVRDGTVVAAAIGDEPLDENRIYTIATFSYVADHLPMFFGLPDGAAPVQSLEVIDRDALVQVARQEGVISGVLETRAVIE